MNIAWESFTPGSALAGGLMIGAAAALLMATLGRIAGISGILGALVPPAAGSAWRVAFIGGLVLSPWLYGLFAKLPTPHFISSTPTLILAGLLVGFGTRWVPAAPAATASAAYRAARCVRWPRSWSSC